MKYSIDIDILKKAKILVIGDVMLDRYLWGKVGRISPEAPVPIVRICEKSEVLGGGGNVAANLSSLGSSVSVIGFRGNDEKGKKLSALFHEKNIDEYLLIDESRPTITKTRVMSQGQQLIRLDEEEKQSFNPDLQDHLFTKITEMLPHCQAVVLSDYGKGMFTSEKLTQHIITLCRQQNVHVLVDPKGKDWERYQGATCITPNSAELELVLDGPLGRDDKSIIAASRKIHDMYGLEWLLVTRGSKGMCLTGSGEPILINANASEVFDVSGAGDTVIATLAAGLGGGLEFHEATELANLAAGVVVGKLGTQPISFAELQSAYKLHELESKSEHQVKITSLEAAKIRVSAWRTSGEKIVFTNGCFDLLHPGHIHLLHQAGDFGDRLVIGLNSDNSVKRLKGVDRPILSENDRAAMLSALECVDLVVIFEDDTPLSIIDALRPDVLVKGADYKEEEVVGQEIVQSSGGSVRLVPLMHGISTTGIVNKLSSEDES